MLKRNLHIFHLLVYKPCHTKVISMIFFLGWFLYNCLGKESNIMALNGERGVQQAGDIERSCLVWIGHDVITIIMKLTM
jgi:hypothetical protein